jgi:hypothetical protein
MCHQELRIIFPPQFEPFQPYLSGPYLKSLLAQCGVRASVCDANIDFYHWLISKAQVQPMPGYQQSESSRFLGRNIARALRVLQREPGSLLEYRWAINVADEYLRARSPQGLKMGLTYLRVGNRYSSTDLRRYLERTDNLFAQYFEDAAGDILGPSDVSVYLFSLVVIDQLAAAVAFTREIRRRRPKARVVIGGPLVSKLHGQLSAVPWITETFDAVLPGEGYRVLPGVLGLAGMHGGHVTPDFSDLDLDRYWSCRRVLPYIVAHGCKWGKCSFCSHHLTYDGYRASAMQDVVADLENLSAKHDAHYVSFCDEYLTPAQLDALAEGLLERRIDVRWSTFARPEAQFQNRDFMHKLYAAGCRMLMFGLESGSQRMLQAMRKGTLVAHFRPILEACKEASIAIRYDFMVGFPSETDEDVRKTYDFIRENRDVIDTPFSSYSVATFELRSGIPVLESANRFRVLPRDPLRGDLDDQYEFESLDGLSVQKRIEWREKLIRLSKQKLGIEIVAPQNKTHQLVLKDLYDEGAFDLPLVTIVPADFATTRVRLAAGVEVRAEGAILRVVNHANGGELEVSQRLTDVFTRFETSTEVQEAFTSQMIWNHDRFASFVNFLYRNDYIELGPVCDQEPAEPKNEEVIYA